MCGHGSQWFSHKLNNQHPLQLKKSKSWEPFGCYQLNSAANLAKLAQFWGKWAGLAVLFSWYLLNSSQDFHSFNCSRCRMFILFDIHWDPCPQIFQGYHFFYRYCEQGRILVTTHSTIMYYLLSTVLWMLKGFSSCLKKTCLCSNAFVSFFYSPE